MGSDLASVLAGYRLGRELGRGSMGRVIAAEHLQLGRPVAIKVLPPGFAADPSVRDRFLSEAKLLASLDHPHVVPVFDFVERDDLCALVMQLLPGGTLRDRFRSSGVSMATACAAALATCSGLEHAHAHRVLHRDVKPSNLVFDEAGRLKVTDFGLAAVLGGEDSLVTLDGEVLGTPAYMAPEQADGSAVGPQADVYAVATMLYEMLSGRLPFSEQGTSLDLLRRRIEEQPVDLHEVAPAVPAGVCRVVMAGLERSPADRPSSAEALGVELAGAAAAGWGPGWTESTDVQVLEGGAIAAAVAAAASTAGTTDRVGARPSTVVRTARDRVTAPGPARSIGAADVIPVASALRPRRPSWAPAAIALVLCAATVAVGLGQSTAQPEDLPAPGTVLLAGMDPAAVSPVPVDLGAPVVVALATVPEGARTVRLDFSAGRVPVGSSNSQPLVPGDGIWAAEVSATSVRVVTSGVLTAEVIVGRDDGGTERVATAAVRPQRPAWATVTGWLGVFGVALVGANAVSRGRAVRRRRRPLRPAVGLVMTGAMAGVLAAWWGWLLGGAVFDPAAALAPAALGACSAVAAVVALKWSGDNRRRRVRRAATSASRR